jgi:hypothetical protein
MAVVERGLIRQGGRLWAEHTSLLSLSCHLIVHALALHLNTTETARYRSPHSPIRLWPKLAVGAVEKHKSETPDKEGRYKMPELKVAVREIWWSLQPGWQNRKPNVQCADAEKGNCNNFIAMVGGARWNGETNLQIKLSTNTSKPQNAKR